MHDGDHDILDGVKSRGHHKHHEENTDKRKRVVKVVAGLISVGLIIAFVLWKLI